MIDVVSIRFKSRGKLYFFDPSGVDLKEGDQVIVETSKGLEMGECIKGIHEVTDDKIVPPLRPVIRVATPEDLRVAEINKSREKEAFEICQKKISEHGLDMKLVDVECNFEGNKILFFFTSDGRVDFRELVKDLASVFRTRIELRQIGVRDEAKMLGGIGICGRPFCCSQFLDDFQPVSTKMAKTQSMSLNPTKISGSCGRLMCCLRYEQAAYEDLVKNSPKSGAFVETPAGYGIVTQLNLLRQKVKVNLDGDGDPTFKVFSVDEVAVVPGGRPKAGESLPSVLQIKPKVEEEEEAEVDPWYIPMLADEVKNPEVKETQTPRPAKKNNKKNNNNRNTPRPNDQQNRSGGNKEPQNQGGQKPQNQNKQKNPNPNNQKPQNQKVQNQGAQKNPNQNQQKPQAKKVIQPKPVDGEKVEVKKPSNKNHRKRYSKPKTNPSAGSPNS